MAQGRLEGERKIESQIRRMINTLPDYVKEWDSYLNAGGKTAQTRRTFIAIVKEFLMFVGNENPNVTIKSINNTKVRNYFIKIQTKVDKAGEAKETSTGYKRLVYSVLNNFFGFLKNDGYIKENYIDNISYPKGNDLVRIKSSRVFLTEEDFNKILNEAKKEKNELYRYRNTCILALLMVTGIRKSALLSINIEDINFETKTLVVIDKGNKYFEYPLPDNVIIIIKEWLEYRKKYLNGEHTSALFISSHNQRFAVTSLDYTVKKYTERALGKGFYAHKIRSGFASINYKHNPDLVFVQKAMGHAYSSTTERYITTDNTEREKAVGYIGSILKSD